MSTSQPKSDLSDFGQLKMPNSGKPEFGCMRGEVHRACGRRIGAYDVSGIYVTPMQCLTRRCVLRRAAVGGGDLAGRLGGEQGVDLLDRAGGAEQPALHFGDAWRAGGGAAPRPRR